MEQTEIKPRKPLSGPPVPWHPDDTKQRADPKLWHTFQAGNADGIVYLHEISNRYLSGESIINEIVVPGTLRLALPYLRKPVPEWYVRNKGKAGHTHELRISQLFWGQHALALAEVKVQELGQQLGCILVSDHAGAVNCLQPEHRNKWVLECTETEGVWAAFYDPSRK